MRLHIAITDIGLKAKMVAFRMKVGDEHQLGNLTEHLARR